MLLEMLAVWLFVASAMVVLVALFVVAVIFGEWISAFVVAVLIALQLASALGRYPDDNCPQCPASA